MNRVKPLKDDPVEGFETNFESNVDAMDVGGVYLQNGTSDDDSVFISRDASDNLVLTDPSSSKKLSDVVTSENGTQHEAIDSLVHNLSETCYIELTRDGSSRAQDEIVWTNNTKTTKIREMNITRDVNGKVSQIVCKQYDASGALIQTLTEVITRDGQGRYLSSAITES